MTARLATGNPSRRAKYLADTHGTLDEVAVYYDRSQATVARWIKAGKLPAVRLGSRVLVAWDDVDALLTPISADD